MDLDDPFECKGHRRPSDHHNRYGHYDDREHHDHGHSVDFLPMLLAHKRLSAVAAVIRLLVLVGVGFLVLPWFWQGFQNVSEHGVQGVVERLWKGPGS